MSDFLFINFFGRLLLVLCPVVAFRFAIRRSLSSWQCLLLSAAAAALSEVLFGVTVATTGLLWFPSTAAFVSAIARAMVNYATGGLLFGAICLWRRVTSTSRLFLIALAMMAALDLGHILIDPVFGVTPNQAHPLMLVIALLIGSLIYAWSPGAERESAVAKARPRSQSSEL